VDADLTAPHSQWTSARFVAPDSVTIVADVGGNPRAPTVILMHGGGQTRHSWASTMRVLVDTGYHVINYDSRGHGESDWSADGVYSFALRAADLRTVLGSVDGPFALIGASMGGITALDAVADGLRPAAVVLVDIVLRPERSGVERVRSFMAGSPDGFANLDEAIAAVAAYNPHRPNPGDPRGLMKNLRLGSDGRLRWHWDPRLVPPDVTKDLAAMEEIIVRLSGVRGVPTLLIRGRHSDVLSDANVEDFTRYLPGAEVYDVVGAGHMVAGDSNEAFTRGVVDYLRRHLPVHIADGESETLRSAPRARSRIS
jgi:pimeloyl-ACP methyl ester carboxylesterase